MPIYEYTCSDCQHSFEALVSASSRPACPSCKGEHLDKRFSVFAVGATEGKAHTSAPVGPCGSCGDPRGPGSCAIN